MNFKKKVETINSKLEINLIKYFNFQYDNIITIWSVIKCQEFY